MELLNGYFVFVEIDSLSSGSQYQIYDRQYGVLEVVKETSVIIISTERGTLYLSLGRTRDVQLQSSKIVVEMPNREKIKIFGLNPDSLRKALQDVRDAIQSHNSYLPSPMDHPDMIEFMQGVQQGADFIARAVGSPPFQLFQTPLNVPNMPRRIRIERRFAQ